MIPHRLIIDGVAAFKSMVSNIILICLLIFIIYPLLKHNFLFSSKTVFIFYTQSESIGPSKTSHFRLFDSDLANFLNLFESKPSNHSLDD